MTTDPSLTPAAPGNNVQLNRRILNYDNITRACFEHCGEQIPFSENRSAILSVTATPLAPTTVIEGSYQEEHTCKCSHCYQLGHQRRTCPTLPCMNCNLMGHLSRYCPDLAEERARERSATTKRYREKLKATGKSEWLFSATRD